MQYLQAAKNCRESSPSVCRRRLLIMVDLLSVLSKDPNARSALSQGELAQGTSASEYLFQTMAGIRKLCRAPHKGLSAPQMLDGRQHLPKSETHCRYSGQSRAHVLLWSAAQNFVCPLPGMFLSDMRLASSY
jgi:hypothetical protein